MSAWPRGLGALHRALGLGLSLVLLAWFASGMVMLFVTYPGRTVAAPSPLDVRTLGALALPHVTPADEPHVTLRRLDGDGPAAWQFLDGDNYRHTLVVDGAALPPPHGDTLTRADQWTLNGSLAPDFPLVRQERDGVVEYRAQASGERVLSLTRAERLWLTLGPVVHWIYPAILRRHRGPWRGVVLMLATLGALLSLSGLVFGLHLQWRARLRWPASPYRKRAPRLHHQVGLGFGVLAFTWTVSGALSFNPWRWSSGDEPSTAERLRFAGGAFAPARFTRSPSAALAACVARAPVVQLVPVQLAAQPWYRCDGADDRTRWTRADGDDVAHDRLPEATLATALQAMRGGAMVEGARHCWCYEIDIPRDVLARVPPQLRDVVCVCRGCATGKASDEPPR